MMRSTGVLIWTQEAKESYMVVIGLVYAIHAVLFHTHATQCYRTHTMASCLVCGLLP